MRVRMLRAVPQFVHVIDLHPGQYIELSEAHAAQFIANGMAEPVAEPVEPAEADDYEAAALRPAKRRG